MKIGFIGLGKLGLPVATCMSMRGQQVYGYDANAQTLGMVTRREAPPYREAGPDGTGEFADHRSNYPTPVASIEDLARRRPEIVFVAVQTPHGPEYEGVTPLPDERADFDYTHLREAVAELAEHIDRDTVIAVISTVLPGTLRREITPLCNAHMRLVYNPSFIAMGKTMADFFDPEFVLLGADDPLALDRMTGFYQQVLPGADVRTMALESAELTKVAYNTFISLKIAFANTLLETCQSIERADVDEVTNALRAARRRIVSPDYMAGGMGDGGGCHPRDNIALSWLARKHGLSFDLFEATMKARERQAERLADMMLDLSYEHDLPMAIAGYAYKPETSLTAGSPALLVKSFLDARTALVTAWDPFVDEPGTGLPFEPHVVLIGCRHAEFAQPDFIWPAGTIIIDPFRYIPDRDGVTVMRLGEGVRASCCGHASDCAVHNAPAYEPGPCDCGLVQSMEA